MPFLNTDAIKKLLEEKKQLVHTKSSEPHDYASVKQRVLQLELEQEIAYLSELLENPDTFEARFKERCAQREKDTIDAIGFNQISSTASNQLYWEIAELVFKPQTLSDMLAILAPRVKKQCQVSLSQDISVPLKKAKMEGIEPVLDSRESTSKLKKEPLLSDLSHYVISGEMIFDVRNIENIPLRSHAKLYEYLKKDYPELCDALYEHNHVLRTLKDDIALFKNQGTTPKEALELLIKGLTLGGERMTGSEYAGQAAVEAIDKFHSFMESLPSETQNHLRNAQGSHGSLGSILDNELKKGTCVETAASHLRAVVEANQNTPLFNQPARMTKESLKQLIKKYKHINPLQDDTGNRKLPEELIKKAIQGIAPKNSFEFISLIMNFPPGLYEELLKNIKLTEPDNTLDDVAELIKQKWLTAEQVNALGSAVIGYYKELNPNGNILRWAVLTNNALYVTKALESIPEKQRLDALRAEDKYGQTVLHYAADNSESLKVILKLIPEQDRLDVVKFQDKYANTVLHWAAKRPAPLKTILELISEQDRLDAIKIKNYNDNTVLHIAADTPESLKTILELIPEQKRLDAIQVNNDDGNTVLHYAADYSSESLKTILELIPAQERLNAAVVENGLGNTMLHNAADKPESLKTILELIPEQDRLNAVMVANGWGNTVLHKATGNPESLKAILELIPEQDRLNAVMVENIWGYTVLHKAADNTESLKTILGLIPEQVRLAAVKVKTTLGYTILDNAADKPESLKAIHELIPALGRLNTAKEEKPPSVNKNSFFANTNLQEQADKKEHEDKTEFKK